MNRCTSVSSQDRVRIPRPQTKQAIIISAGYMIPTPTPHRYKDTRRTSINSPDGECFEHIFVCEETGKERRYGTVRLDWETS